MSRRLSRLAGALALSCAALLAVPATAAADPAPADPLARAIAALQGQDGASLAAATAIAAAAVTAPRPHCDCHAATAIALPSQSAQLPSQHRGRDCHRIAVTVSPSCKQ